MDFLFFALLFIYGTALGSFFNVLIDRLPNEESIMGRSHCDHCKKKLQGLDLVPIFSYVFLHGRCRYCKKKLSIFYPFVEIFTGIAFILTWIYAPITSSSGILNTLDHIMYLGIVSTLIVIFFADLKYQIIPDSMQVSLFLFSFGLHLVHGTTASHYLNFIFSGLGIMTPILFLFLITRGGGMGFGDVKLAFTIGFLLGLKGGIMVLYVSFLSGGIMGALLLMLRRKGMKSTIAFGPYLVLGILVVLFFNDYIQSLLSAYYGL